VCLQERGSRAMLHREKSATRTSLIRSMAGNQCWSARRGRDENVHVLLIEGHEWRMARSSLHSNYNFGEEVAGDQVRPS
jgi:hypothetical protein